LTENEGEPFPPKSSNLAQDVLFKSAKKIRKKYEGVIFIGPNSCHNDKSDRCDKSRKVVVIEDPSLQTVACLILEDLHTIVERYRANIAVKIATIYDEKGLSATADWTSLPTISRYGAFLSGGGIPPDLSLTGTLTLTTTGYRFNYSACSVGLKIGMPLREYTRISFYVTSLEFADITFYDVPVVHTTTGIINVTNDPQLSNLSTEIAEAFVYGYVVVRLYYRNGSLTDIRFDDTSMRRNFVPPACVL